VFKKFSCKTYGEVAKLYALPPWQRPADATALRRTVHFSQSAESESVAGKVKDMVAEATSASDGKQRKKLEATEKKKQGVMDALAASQRAADAADPSSWKDHLQGGAIQGCICRRAGEECRDPNCAWRTKAATAQPAADVLDLCDSDDSDNAGAPKTDLSATTVTRAADEDAGVGGAKKASSVGRKVKDMVTGAASQVVAAAAAVAQLVTPKKRREQKRQSREEGAAAGSADRQPQEKKQRITEQVARTAGATFPALSLTSTPLSIAASRSNSSDVDEDDDDDDDVAEMGHQRSGQFTL
jgi:hypothetical protein